jgi:hypothetical protein
VTHFQKTQDGLPPEKRTFRVTRKGVKGSGQRYSSIVPEVHTSHAQEVSPDLILRLPGPTDNLLVVYYTRRDRGCP